MAGSTTSWRICSRSTGDSTGNMTSTRCAVVFQKTPPAGQANLPPSAGLQFFGQVDIDPRSRDLVVVLTDLAGDWLFSQRLQAQPIGDRGWRDE